jgi:hypothetical protein
MLMGNMPILVLSILILLSCSHQPPVVAAPTLEQSPEPIASAPEIKKTVVKPGQTSDLRVKLSEYLQNNPDTSFKAAVSLANKMLHKYGLITNIGVSQALSKGGHSISLRTGSKEF